MDDVLNDILIFLSYNISILLVLFAEYPPINSFTSRYFLLFEHSDQCLYEDQLVVVCQ